MEEKGVVTVCDPAVGYGIMLLAFASVVHDTFGRWGTSRLRLYGQDIDLRCVNMCRIQLRMNGLDGTEWMTGMSNVGKVLDIPGQLMLKKIIRNKINTRGIIEHALVVHIEKGSECVKNNSDRKR